MDAITLTLFVLGLFVLIGGAEFLVRGASALATSVGISPLVIGLTVVAFGTSSPELAVSVQSGLAGQSDISLGNVVGSSLFNILFILGISALITPLRVSRQLVRLDVPIMILVSILVFILGLDHNIGKIDGLIFCIGLIIYIAWSIYQSRRENKLTQAEQNQNIETRSHSIKRQVIVQLTQIIAGLILLTLGSHWLVNGAVVIAKALGISELIIGLTIIAMGTSLPEVATSIVASIRGEGDIAVGNIIGSNIFNILSVLGVSALILPFGINVPTEALNFDIPVMIAVALACLPIFFTGHTISRWEGALFFGYYLAYTLYLILNATQHAALPAFSTIMAVFILPLTGITLLVLFIRAFSRPDRNC